MNTPTHFLITAAIRKAAPGWNIPRGAVWLGSVAPDIPLYLLSIGGLLYYRYALGWELRDAARHIFDTLYFEDPVWISLHNVLHSPLSLALLLVAAEQLGKRSPAWGRWLRWFLLACLLHSAVDIVTHHDDGPVLLWPLIWEWRYRSPISYWDHRHFGTEVARFEFALVLALSGYLGWCWFQERGRRQAVTPSSPETRSPNASGREMSRQSESSEN